MSYLPLFMERYESLGIRRDSFKKFFEICEERKAKTIVETGTTSVIDWARAGCSTILFGEYCTCNNGTLLTIDMNQWAVQASQANTTLHANKITYSISDSVDELSRFTNKIDALYLDSMDYQGTEEEKEKSRQHHLKEIQAAYGKLHDNSVIMIDDCKVPDGTMGKGELVVKWLNERGWKQIISDYQIIMVKDLSAEQTPKVFVSFSTLPSRIGRTEKMVNSILSQTHKPHKFVLCIPSISHREKTAYEPLPDFIKNNVEVIWSDRDYGPATKLIPMLDRVETKDIIITVDDDVIYDKHLIEELVSASMIYKDKRLGFMGSFNNKFIHAEHIKECSKCDVLGGYRGILYKRSFIDKKQLLKMVYDLSADGVVLCDDQVFHKHVLSNGIESLIIPTSQPTRTLTGGNFEFLNLGNGVNDNQNAEKTALQVAELTKLTSK